MSAQPERQRTRAEQAIIDLVPPAPDEWAQDCKQRLCELIDGDGEYALNVELARECAGRAGDEILRWRARAEAAEENARDLVKLLDNEQEHAKTAERERDEARRRRRSARGFARRSPICGEWPSKHLSRRREIPRSRRLKRAVRYPGKPCR